MNPLVLDKLPQCYSDDQYSFSDVFLRNYIYLLCSRIFSVFLASGRVHSPPHAALCVSLLGSWVYLQTKPDLACLEGSLICFSLVNHTLILHIRRLQFGVQCLDCFEYSCSLGSPSICFCFTEGFYCRLFIFFYYFSLFHVSCQASEDEKGARLLRTSKKVLCDCVCPSHNMCQENTAEL